MVFNRSSRSPLLLGADTAKTIARVISRGGAFWYSSPRHSRDFLRQAVPVWRRALDEAERPFPASP
jgi:transposase